MATHYLSFADPHLPEGQQWLGAVILESDDCLGFVGAVTASHMLGLNPGGEVVGFEVPDGYVARKWMGRLLTRADIEAMDAEMLS